MTLQYHSIIGLPESGKTTFLAALWHIIDAGEITTQLELDKLVGDHSYLNGLVEPWRRCFKVPRTSRQEEANISIYMHHPATDQHFVIGFQDLSGESFEAQFSDRECSEAYVKANNLEGGLILFINADSGLDGVGITDLQPILQGGGEGQLGEQVADWSPKNVPQQVRLVDLLQFLLKPPFELKRRRMAIAISAWDVIAEPDLAPECWLKRECPLLWQYLVSNAEYFEYAVYGISAQGGDLPRSLDKATEEQKDSRNALLEKIPSERVRCVGPGAHQHDLTAPICWLMETD